MNVAICEPSLRMGMPGLPLVELFDRAAAFSYDGIELATAPIGDERSGTPRDVRPGAATRDVAAIRATARERGIEIPTVCAAWMPAYAELHPSLEDWGRATELFKEDADFAASVGAKVLVLTLASARGTWSRACALLGAWAAHGAKRGVKVGVEWSSLHRAGTGGLDAMIRLVDEIGNPSLGIFANPELPGMGNAQEIRHIGHRIVGLRSSALRPDVDYDAMFDVLCDVDYHWYWIFDVRGDDVATSRRRFDEIWSGAADG